MAREMKQKQANANDKESYEAFLQMERLQKAKGKLNFKARRKSKKEIQELEIDIRDSYKKSLKRMKEQ